MRNDTMASILIVGTFLVLLSVVVVLVHEIQELQQNCQAHCLMIYALEEEVL
jgi:hypothetical protein